MRAGRILAEGKDLGTGFALTSRAIVTANHVIRNQEIARIRYRPIEALSLQIERIDQDESLDIAILFLNEDVPENMVLAIDEATEGDTYSVEAQPRSNDPVLSGAIDAARMPFKNEQGRDTHVMQLRVAQFLGDYEGYSGSPVTLQKLSHPVVGVLVEQLRWRIRPQLNQSRPPASNVLYAIPIKDVLDRFHLSGVRRAASIQPPAPKAFRLTHNPHILLGDIPLTCRTDELDFMSQWDLDDEANVLCLIGPGGQGKSALAWTHFDRSVGIRNHPGSSRSGAWHDFSLDQDHFQALAQSLRTFASALLGDPEREVTLDRALGEIESQSVLLTLDGIEHTYGTTGRLLDSLSSTSRTVADLRIEAIIRRLASSGRVRLVITARLLPSFLDDPAIAKRVRRLDLASIPLAEAGAFWLALGVNGTVDDYATAAASLRGNPLLMQLAARWLTAHDPTSINVARWMVEFPDFLSTISQHEEFQQATLVHALADLAAPERQRLLMLAATRRRLTLDEWLRDLKQDAEPDIIESRRRAVGPLLERGVVHQRADGRYEMHDIVAEAALRTASRDELMYVYRSLDDQYGPRLFWVGHPSEVNYDEEIIKLESVRDIESKIGYFLSLLDRDLFDDAHHVFFESLYTPLRFRLGELRLLHSLIAQFRASYLRKVEAPVRLFNGLLGELAIFDARPSEALQLIDSSENDVGNTYLIAQAFSASGDFLQAYQSAQNACYLALRKVTIDRDRDYTAFQIMADRHLTESTMAMIDFILSLRTLAQVLVAGGYPRTALLVATAAALQVEGSAQPGITSMAYEILGNAAFTAGLLDEARSCCERALSEANEMKVEEHQLNVRLLDLKIRSVTEKPRDIKDALFSLAVQSSDKGFGRIAVDCLLIARSLGIGDLWLSESASWRYRVVADTNVSIGDGGERSLLEELTNLRTLHPLGRWFELPISIALISFDSGRMLDFVTHYSTIYKRISGEAPSIDIPDVTRKLCGAQIPQINAFLSDLNNEINPKLESVRTGQDVRPHADEWFMHILREDESHKASLREMAICYKNGGDKEVFEFAKGGVYYLPNNEEVRLCLLNSGRATGEVKEAISILLEISGNQASSAEVLFDVANVLREDGEFSSSSFISDSVHRAQHKYLGGIGLEKYIANVLGFGLDLIALGYDAKAIVNVVKRGFQGMPLIHRYSGDDSEAFAQGMKILGGLNDDHDLSRSIGPGSWMGRIEEKQMIDNKREFKRSSAFAIAVRAFERLSVSGSRRSGFHRSGKANRRHVVDSLRLIRGHAHEVERMLSDVEGDEKVP